MRLLITWISIAAWPGAVLSKYGRCGVRGQSQRIINGYMAGKHEFPWQVSLRFKSGQQHVCGGSILNQKWILTAAHCFIKAGVHQVAVGWHTTFWNLDEIKPEDKKKGTGIFDIEQVINHPFFDLRMFENDIALIKIKMEIDFSTGEEANVRQVCLPPANFESPTGGGEMCIVSGFGVTKYDKPDSKVSLPLSPFLQYATLALLDRDSCKDKVTEATINMNVICNDNSNQKGHYYGDIGGPLVCRRSSGQFEEIGIANYVHDQGLAPGVYTKVSSFIDWIVDQTGADDLAISEGSNSLSPSSSSFSSSYSLSPSSYSLSPTVVMLSLPILSFLFRFDH